MTINPARIIGVDDRLGSLTAGKDADLVIWSGDPLDVMSRAERAYLDGREIYRYDYDRRDGVFASPWDARPSGAGLLGWPGLSSGQAPGLDYPLVPWAYRDEARVAPNAGLMASTTPFRRRGRRAHGGGPSMSLSTWELQSLDSIKDGLTGSDPELAALLITFTRLTAGRGDAGRGRRCGPGRAGPSSGRAARARRGRDQAGQAYQRLRSRYAVLAWLLVTMVMIGTALALSRVTPVGLLPVLLGAACASAAPVPGPPFPG